MSVRLYARGSDGVVAITDGGVSDATHTDYLDKPVKNLGNIHFHSDLDYMSVAATFTATISFPKRDKQTQTDEGKKSSTTFNVPATGVQRYELGTHGLGFIPFATAVRGGQQVTPTFPLQLSGASLRLINVEMDTSKIYVYESWVTYGTDLAAKSETFTVWVFRNPA
jgi:hypothetical protein